MSDEFSPSPHAHTMQKLEQIKQVMESGKEFWLARDIHTVLGYPTWSGFEPVISRAATAIKQNGGTPSQHIGQATKEWVSGNNVTHTGRDYYLSRGACYVIAMNGDSAKPEIAAAQIYFAIQTRRMEQQDAKSEEVKSEDAKRLLARGKVSTSFKAVSRIASDVGVPSGRQGLFHEQRYKGLYDTARANVYEKKGLSPKEDILDRIGTLELSAHEFQMNLAASALANENIHGEKEAIKKNLAIAEYVRRTIKDSGATLPEDLLLEEHISSVRKRLTGKKTKEVPTPEEDANASKQLSLLSPISDPEKDS